MSSTYPSQGGRPGTVPTEPGKSPAQDQVQAAAQDAKQAGADLKDEAKRVASEVSAEGAKVARDVKAAGQELGSAAAEKAEALAEQGKQAGAERGAGLAEATRRVADDLEGTSPEIARHVRTAADSIESVANSLRERSVGDLMQDASSFARHQPAAFFGAAMLAGFAIARFAKSSSGGMSGATQSRYPQRGYSGAAPSAGVQGDPSYGVPAPSSPGRAPGWVPAGDERSSETLKPATMPAATLGGAVAHKPGDAKPGSMPTIPKETP